MKMVKLSAIVVASLAFAVQARAAEQQLMNDVDAEAARAEGSPEAPANEQQQLSNDMKDGHEAATRQDDYQPVPTVTTTSMDSSTRGVTQREGFTFEIGGGVHYSSEYIDKDRRIAGMLGGSLGWFLNDNTALLLRVAGSSITVRDDQVVFAEGEDRAAERYRGATTYFIGPQIQFFPHDRVMLAAGVGLGGVVYSTRVDIDDADDVHSSNGDAGIGASVRLGFTVYQRESIAALRIGLEALPMYVADDWRISTGLVGELQVF